MTDIQKAIGQMERISKSLGSMGETEDYTNITIYALEKQVPKQVNYICGILGEKYECPECGSGVTDTDLFPGHCKWCGQAIKDN